MKSTPSFWQKIGLHEWFVKKDADPYITDLTITPDDIYKYLVEKFRESVNQLSFANRVVFYHEYIIGFNPDDYRDFMDNKKGPLSEASVFVLCSRKHYTSLLPQA